MSQGGYITEGDSKFRKEQKKPWQVKNISELDSDNSDDDF